MNKEIINYDCQSISQMTKEEWDMYENYIDQYQQNNKIYLIRDNHIIGDCNVTRDKQHTFYKINTSDEQINDIINKNDANIIYIEVSKNDFNCKCMYAKIETDKYFYNIHICLPKKNNLYI